MSALPSATFDHLGGHIHRSACKAVAHHPNSAQLRRVWHPSRFLHSSLILRKDLGSTEIDEFDVALVVEQDVYIMSRLELCRYQRESAYCQA
jgi:hypothetical protein